MEGGPFKQFLERHFDGTALPFG